MHSCRIRKGFSNRYFQAHIDASDFYLDLSLFKNHASSEIHEAIFAICKSVVHICDIDSSNLRWLVIPASHRLSRVLQSNVQSSALQTSTIYSLPSRCTHTRARKLVLSSHSRALTVRIYIPANTEETCPVVCGLSPFHVNFVAFVASAHRHPLDIGERQVQDLQKSQQALNRPENLKFWNRKSSIIRMIADESPSSWKILKIYRKYWW